MSQDEAAHPETIDVVIVDDHRIFRQGLQINLDFEKDIRVVGQGANGEEALQRVRELQPDVVIMDINLPLMNGIQVTRQLVSEHLSTRVVMLTAYDDAEQMMHAMRAGAAAYCVKEIEPEKLIEVIRHVHQGRYVVNDQVFDRSGIERWIRKGIESIAGQYYADMAETFSPLSPREMEILQYVTRGLSNKEIAHALQISHQTVKNHMTSILRKLAVEDRTQAAVYALRRGWVRLNEPLPDPGAKNTD
ncbi:MAG TPA: response regulator transcription factor [Chloroflexi bacterium]|nr:response regulator transcription factor [Chloroflexota bacterium]